MIAHCRGRTNCCVAKTENTEGRFGICQLIRVVRYSYTCALDNEDRPSLYSNADSIYTDELANEPLSGENGRKIDREIQASMWPRQTVSMLKEQRRHPATTPTVRAMVIISEVIDKFTDRPGQGFRKL